MRQTTVRFLVLAFALAVVPLGCASRSSSYMSVWLSDMERKSTQDGGWLDGVLDDRVVGLVARMSCVRAAAPGAGYSCFMGGGPGEPTVFFGPGGQKASKQHCTVKKERKINPPILQLAEGAYFRDRFRVAQMELAERGDKDPEYRKSWVDLDAELREINEAYKHGVSAEIFCRKPGEKSKSHYRVLVGSQKDLDEYRLLYICQVSKEDDCKKNSYFRWD